MLVLLVYHVHAMQSMLRGRFFDASIDCELACGKTLKLVSHQRVHNVVFVQFVSHGKLNSTLFICNCKASDHPYLQIRFLLAFQKKKKNCFGLEERELEAQYVLL